MERQARKSSGQRILKRIRTLLALAVVSIGAQAFAAGPATASTEDRPIIVGVPNNGATLDWIGLTPDGQLEFYGLPYSSPGEWFRCASSSAPMSSCTRVGVSGETGDTPHSYTLRDADVGSYIRVLVHSRDDSGADVDRWSDAFGPIQDAEATIAEPDWEPSATAMFSGGTIEVSGVDGPETVTVSKVVAMPEDVPDLLSVKALLNAGYTIADTSLITAGAGCTQVSPMSVVCGAVPDAVEDPVRTIRVDGRGGDDTIDFDSTSVFPEAVAVGGPGNDTAKNADKAFGDDGADIVYGRDRGGSSGTGGDGNDSISGVDLADGGTGNDTIRGRTRSGGYTDLEGGTFSFGTIHGGSGDDFIYGNGPTYMYGDDGADRLYGSSGDDHMYGGLGVDVASGGSGDDVLDGEADSDTLDGGAGDDGVNGGDGNDTVMGGSGNDGANGYYGNDTVNGGTGTDRVLGQYGNDIVDGGPDSDMIYPYSQWEPTISGGPGDDQVFSNDSRWERWMDCGTGIDTLTKDPGDPDPQNCETVINTNL